VKRRAGGSERRGDAAYLNGQDSVFSVAAMTALICFVIAIAGPIGLVVVAVIDGLSYPSRSNVLAAVGYAVCFGLTALATALMHLSAASEGDEEQHKTPGPLMALVAFPIHPMAYFGTRILRKQRAVLARPRPLGRWLTRALAVLVLLSSATLQMVGIGVGLGLLPIVLSVVAVVLWLGSYRF